MGLPTVPGLPVLPGMPSLLPGLPTMPGLPHTPLGLTFPQTLPGVLQALPGMRQDGALHQRAGPIIRLVRVPSAAPPPVDEA
eukprot:4455515-Prymnesium_polylepis.1